MENPVNVINMSNRLISKSQMRRFVAQAMTEAEKLVKDCKKCQNPKLKIRHTCGAVKVTKLPEDLTKITDEALEMRIFYSQDVRAGELFGPLFDEYRRRFKELQKAAQDYSEI
jgi:hypothetical protein